MARVRGDVRLCVHVVCDLNTVLHLSGCLPLRLKSYSAGPRQLLSPARALSLGFCAGAWGSGHCVYSGGGGRSASLLVSCSFIGK